MTELNIESIGADWCIDDIIKYVMDDNGGSFNTNMIHIPENKLPHLKGTLTINNTAVNLSEAYSLDSVRKNPSGPETYYGCYFMSSEFSRIIIVLDSSFKPIHALINNNPNPVEPLA